MADYCAHCGKELPLTMREPKKYRHRNDFQRRQINAALCEVCKEKVKNEGYEVDNKEG